mmetsp:Transcript_33650/g.96295  ORF Transcript_33650/g.96295 Transcript_33650/m.96295 type:complete len:236 (-) Transcript_33650:10-717(-)
MAIWTAKAVEHASWPIMTAPCTASMERAAASAARQSRDAGSPGSASANQMTMEQPRRSRLKSASCWRSPMASATPCATNLTSMSALTTSFAAARCVDGTRGSAAQSGSTCSSTRPPAPASSLPCAAAASVSGLTGGAPAGSSACSPRWPCCWLLRMLCCPCSPPPQPLPGSPRRSQAAAAATSTSPSSTISSNQTMSPLIIAASILAACAAMPLKPPSISLDRQYKAQIVGRQSP